MMELKGRDQKVSADDMTRKFECNSLKRKPEKGIGATYRAPCSGGWADACRRKEPSFCNENSIINQR